MTTESATRKTDDAVTTVADCSPKSLTDGRANMTDRERIEIVLNRVRPFLQADGVDVELVEVRGNGASVRLTGFCLRCATATLNFQAGLEAVLREEIKGFGELRLTTT